MLLCYSFMCHREYNYGLGHYKFTMDRGNEMKQIMAMAILVFGYFGFWILVFLLGLLCEKVERDLKDFNKIFE